MAAPGKLTGIRPDAPSGTDREGMSRGPGVAAADGSDGGAASVSSPESPAASASVSSPESPGASAPKSSAGTLPECSDASVPSAASAPSASSDDTTAPADVATPDPERPPRRTLTWIAGAALAAAAAFAAWSAWSWHAAATAPASADGATRDEATAAGRTLIATVTTFDPQHRDQDLAHWRDATTGSLQASLAGTAPPSGPATTGHVLDAGLSELNAEAGTAKLLASVEITVTADGAAQPARRTRLAATLARTASGWKLSSLDQLGVAGS